MLDFLNNPDLLITRSLTLLTEVLPAVAEPTAAEPTAVGGTLILLITIFVLAVFVGVEIIVKIPPTLHTPCLLYTSPSPRD